MLVLFSGLVCIFSGCAGNDFWWKEKAEIIRTILISVGCSLIATSIVTYFYMKYQAKHQKVKELMDIWGLRGIYETRSLMNSAADEAQESARKCVDAIGFGFSSWRQNKAREVRQMLQRGVKIRLLSPLPDTEFVKQREKDEEVAQGNISQSIHLLHKWVDGLKKYGDIELRFYKSLPLDFYFRVDDALFIGPYLYKKQSQQTVSYEFCRSGNMFSEYTQYFEIVWKDAISMKQDTEERTFESWLAAK